jgi:hypothetical protein
MYTEIGDHVDLCQGDVIANVLLSRVPDLANPELYDHNGDRIEVPADQPLPEGIGIVTVPQKSNVLILSQCCDCLRKPFLVVCRILPIEEFDNQYLAKNARNRVKYIQENYQRPAAKPDTFYLQEAEAIGFPKSIAYFLEQFNIPREPNEQFLRENRLLRLSQEAVLDLQFRHSYCFGRFATEEDYMLTPTDRANLEN